MYPVAPVNRTFLEKVVVGADSLQDKKYFNNLSDASKISLKLQGGLLNNEESTEFEKQSYFKSAILLRKFDEAAKRTDVKMKTIQDYQNLLSSKLI